MTEVNPLGVIALVDVLILLVTSLLLVYPVVRHADNVAHSSGFVALAVAFLLLTAAATDAFLVGPGLRNTALGFFASLAALAGTWVFARPFLPLEAVVGRVAGRSTGSVGDEQSVPDSPAFEGRFDGGDQR